MLLSAMSLVVERFARPFILWAIGRNVYRRLTELVGRKSANAIACVYGAGGKVSSAELDRLIQRNAHVQNREPKGAVQ